MTPCLCFMDLPPEIRLQIYPHLLTATRTSLYLFPSTHQECHRRSEPTTTTIELSFSSISHYREKEGESIADDEGFVDWDESLDPTILRTCRIIYQEAIPILYSTNTFSFRAMPSSRDNDLMFWDEPVIESVVSPLPLFLRAIGHSNAIHIRSIILGGTDTTTAATHLLTALPLTLSHLPNLIFLQLLVDEKYVDWDDPFAPNPLDDEAMANGPFESMYDALQQFVERVHWLEGFRYEDTIGQWQFAEDDALEMLKEMEEIVEKKAWENLEKVENRRWRRIDGHWRMRAFEEEMERSFEEFWHRVDG
ncbi:MAG: hypothetical protein L6R37_006922 [Teloschistes peruensis]|nr:MAG: hypothetical protein L6R37_006922 [Teloschistes peruensis]